MDNVNNSITKKIILMSHMTYAVGYYLVYFYSNPIMDRHQPTTYILSFSIKSSSLFWVVLNVQLSTAVVLAIAVYDVHTKEVNFLNQGWLQQNVQPHNISKNTKKKDLNLAQNIQALENGGIGFFFSLSIGKKVTMVPIHFWCKNIFHFHNFPLPVFPVYLAIEIVLYILTPILILIICYKNILL